MPSFQEQILPICDRVITSNLPPEAAKQSEEMHEALESATTKLSGYFANTVMSRLDSDLDGVLSQQEIAALEGKSVPIKIKFTLTLEE
jgi:hypothetical protein